MTSISHTSTSEPAEILAQTLPHLRQFHGATMVIKYGGNAMTDPALQSAFAQDLVLLKLIGIKPVVVHGGGPQIEAALNRLGKNGQFIQGLRVTDVETMQVVQWVLAGQVQQEIVGLINQEGGRAVGLSGCDGALLCARKLKLRDHTNPSIEHDVGLVGTVVNTDTGIIKTLQNDGFIPVVSPIGFDQQNQSYNINADAVAAHLAVALKAEKLLLLTNISGVLDQNGKLLTNLSAQRIDELIAKGTIHGGMLPKIAGALDAAKSGVGSVHILDGRIAHVLLLALLTNQAIGSMIHA